VTRQWAQAHPNALDEGQQIADTSRPAVEQSLEGAPLKIPARITAVISLPNFPVGVDPTRLQRAMSDMIEFGFFKGKQLTAAKKFQVKNVVYAANLDGAGGQASLLGS
jgi:hypothetical protein